MSDYGERTKAVGSAYDRMAADYDNIDGEAFYANQYEVYNRHMLKNINGKYKRTLDVGCGTGIQTIQLTRHSKYSVGIDISYELLKVAKKKSNCLNDVDYIRADAVFMPFRDSVFDCVISYGETISHTELYERALEEIFRVTRIEGSVHFSVLNKWNVGVLCSEKELRHALSRRSGHMRTWICYLSQDGDYAALDLKTFSRKELETILSRNEASPISYTGIHILSLLIPLHLQYARMGFWGRLFRILGKLDLSLNEKWPFSWLGYTVIVSARKIGAIK